MGVEWGGGEAVYGPGRGGGLEVYQTSTIINTPNIYYFICEATGLFLITGDISL